MAALSISPQVFAILSALIEEKTGIHYGPQDAEVLAEKVSTRAVEAGYDSLLDYYYFLRYDTGSEVELDALIDALVVNETYFFRELEPLQLVVRDVVRPMVAAGMVPRIWSAACATGEEPLTLAMLLADAGLLHRVNLLATDISPRALHRARGGRFGKRSLRREYPVDIVQRYIREEGEELVVASDVHRAVNFRRLNLTDAEAVARLGTFDVLLCRNVLIYFRDEMATRVVDALGRALNREGRLFVGVSESLMRFGTSLQCEEHHGVFFYRKAF